MFDVGYEGLVDMVKRQFMVLSFKYLLMPRRGFILGV